jgi:GGDEF domain-containing protein
MFVRSAYEPLATMISIKRLLESRLGDRREQDLAEALRQTAGLLLDGMATHLVRGRPTDAAVFRRTLTLLARQLLETQSPIGLLGISSDATEALETYSQRTNAYLSEANEQMGSMIALLIQTVSELSGQADASVARLQAIEKQIEQASGLDDRRALRKNLEDCLLALREAAAQQRTSSDNTVQSLQHRIEKAQRHTAELTQEGLGEDDISLIPELSASPEAVSVKYVAAFRLQRAEHIASRFGENVKNQMLSLIGTQLKAALGSGDRLLRWKGSCFVMFLNSTEHPSEVRQRLSQAVTVTQQQYIEVGRKSALLSVGVDWTMFPESQCPSLEAVFTEVDAFLARANPRIPTTAGVRA